MMNKIELMSEVQTALNLGVITEADLKLYITQEPAVLPSVTPEPIVIQQQATINKPEKLSAVDIMFYIAGLVLFSAIMSTIVQSWNDGSAVVHILLSAGVGAGLWAIAYYLLKNPVQNDIRKGLVNSLLLTGSLSVIAGGYIITNELIDGYGEVNFIPGAIMLAVIGGIHLVFDKYIKKDLTLLLGILLCVTAFPALMFGLLKDSGVPNDVWAIILIFTAGLLAYATRVVVKMNSDRYNSPKVFDYFAVFVALITMYSSSFGTYGVLWLAVLIVSVFVIFYLSIISQNKNLLGNASFFLVLTVITISFKYFSGFGITTSLILATIGLLGSAAVAAGINKKYFKQSSVSAPSITDQQTL